MFLKFVTEGVIIILLYKFLILSHLEVMSSDSFCQILIKYVMLFDELIFN
jgi:hypothetical protein